MADARWTEAHGLRMLGVMRSRAKSGWSIGVAAAVLAGAVGSGARAQGCTTQAKMTAGQRAEVGAAAYRLATAVVKGDTATVQAGTIPQFATNFGATADLVHSTAAQLAGDSVTVTQAYLLDASNRPANDASDADFSCPLTGTAAETDFSIAGLPTGRYAFVLTEAAGVQPWDLAFLLQSNGSGWQMAGFYPHPREAVGHAGTWYWTQARADARSGESWLAWLLYGEADQLLRPANFVSTTNLDRLRSERRAVAPATVGEGISNTSPLTLQGANGMAYRVTGLNSEVSADGKELNLVLHLHLDGQVDESAGTQRSLAAAAALLAAHPELRAGFANVVVIAEAPGANPVITERPMAQIAAK